MGIFNRKPKAGDAEAPLLVAEDETSIVVPAGVTTWSYKKVLKSLGWERPAPGKGTDRLVVTVKVFGLRSAGIVNVDHQGQPLGSVPEDDVWLVHQAMDEVGSKVIRAEAYIWRSQRDGTYGLRVFLPD